MLSAVKYRAVVGKFLIPPGIGQSVKSNRRNYYRVLQVQPDAPLAVIRASYRALMSNLRQHPDLGGDHEAAVLLNEAYAVLSDPSRRRLYDHALVRAGTPGRAQFHATHGPVPALPNPSAHESLPPATHAQLSAAVRARAVSDGYGQLTTRSLADDAVEHPVRLANCAFCGCALPRVIRHDTRCRRCESPLAPPLAWSAAGDRSPCRRALPRVVKIGAVLIREDWRRPPYAGRLRDLSVTGISVITDLTLQALAVVRIVGSSFDVVAEVISCREAGGSCSLHARLLSAIFPEHTGTFVSMRA